MKTAAELHVLRAAIALSDRSYADVAKHLWPDKKPRVAHVRLMACLNPEKKDHLSFRDVIAICRFCGRFDPLMWMCQELSHEAKAITKQDELARLLEQYLEARRITDRVGPQIEKLRTVG